MPVCVALLKLPEMHRAWNHVDRLGIEDVHAGDDAATASEDPADVEAAEDPGQLQQGDTYSRK